MRNNTAKKLDNFIRQSPRPMLGDHYTFALLTRLQFGFKHSKKGLKHSKTLLGLEVEGNAQFLATLEELNLQYPS